jgi:hypothetical protein
MKHTCMQMTSVHAGGLGQFYGLQSDAEFLKSESTRINLAALTAQGTQYTFRSM